MHLPVIGTVGWFRSSPQRGGNRSAAQVFGNDARASTSSAVTPIMSWMIHWSFTARVVAVAAGASLIAGVAACGSGAKPLSLVSAAVSHGRVWGMIGPFQLGMLQSAVYKTHGYGSTGEAWPWTSYRVAGGTVKVGFLLRRRLSDLSCATPGFPQGGGCPKGFQLPDGVAVGTLVPARSPWRGYTRSRSSQRLWEKTVRTATRRISVTIFAMQGKVVFIGESTTT